MALNSQILKVVCLCVAALLFITAQQSYAQQIDPATGGGAISADDFNSGTYTTLSEIVITETSAGQLAVGFIDFTAPSGYEWDTSGADPTVTVTLAPGNNGQTKLEMSFVSRSASIIRFEVTSDSDSGPRRPGRATFSSFSLRPTTGTIPNSSFIKNTGNSGPAGNTSYGDLVMVPGAPAKIRVENQANGSGAVVPAQNVTAGNSLTVYSISRDQNNNFIENTAADNWTITNGTDGVDAADITAAGDNKSATFSSTNTGTGNIQATKSGLTPTASGTITVKAAAANALTIITQPSGSATAGQNFAQQPVIDIIDIFGNRVKSDNTTQITAARKAGSGTLQGTKTVTVQQGRATFTNLKHNIANSISIQFNASGFSGITSNTITINPAAASKLAFTTQPPNSSKNVALDPAPVVQVQDTFGNHVSQSGTSVTVTKASGPGSITGGSTTSVNTNTSGAAVFYNIAIDINGSYTLQAAASGLTSVTSNTFQILNSGELAQFEITTTSDAPIGSQTAGQTFTIKIKAIDGTGALLDGTGQPEYTRKAFVTSSGNTGTGLSDSTANFSGGEVTHVVALEKAGDFSITVTGKNASETTITSLSNDFSVTPATADPDSSLISSAPESIVADGSSTSLITVQLKDEFGNPLASGGDTVVLSTTAGTLLGSVTDNGDGTYEQSLQSTTTAQTVSVSATVNSSSITSGDASVNFVAGGLDHFAVQNTSGGAIPSQTAGQAFNIRVVAQDVNNNTVTTFNGSVDITSNKTITSGGGTASLTNGILGSRSVTITGAGQNSVTITAKNSNGTQTGTSAAFTVNPAAVAPSVTTITPANRFIENTGSATTTITVQAKDQYGNNRLTSSGTVTLSTTAGTLQGSVSDNGDGTYTQTLQSSTAVTIATITGTIGGSSITDDARVSFAEFNEWQSAGGGGPNPTTWNRGSNWTLGVPTASQAVFIPTNPTGGQKFPIVKSSSPTMAFLVIESDATVNVNPGNSITVTADVIGAGALIVDQASATIGGNIEVANFNAGSSTVTLNGTDQQEIPGSLLTNILNIQNSSPNGISSNGYVNADERLTVTNSTLTMDAGSTFEVFGDVTGNGTIESDNATFSIGGDVTISTLNAANSDVTFDPTFGTAGIQTINNISGYRNLTINNIDGVVINGNTDISQTLTIQAGSSLDVTGNLTASDISATGGDLNLQGNLNITSVTQAPSTVLFDGTADQKILNFGTFANLTVDKSSGRVESGSDIIVNNNLTLTSGDFVMGPGTNLLAPNRSLPGGTIRFQLDLATPGWYTVSSPIASTYSDFLDAIVTQGYPGAFYDSNTAPHDTLQPSVLYYDETGSGTDNQRYRTLTNASNTVEEARGHFVYVFGNIASDSRYNNTLPDTLEVGGAEFEGDGSEVNFDVTYTAAGDGGFNLIGNPYGATIDWDDNANWTKTNMDDAIYVWDKSANGGNGDYLVWNGFTGSLGNGLIAPFQAFWVKADTTAPLLKVQKEAKTVGGEFRSGKNNSQRQDETAVIAFDLSYQDLNTKAYISFAEGADREKDRQDAFRLVPFTDTYLELFTTLGNGTQLTINNLPPKFGQPIEIPIFVAGYRDDTPVNGTFTLSWPELKNIPSEWGITLIDRETGQEIDINKESFYSFDVRAESSSKANGGLSKSYTIRTTSDNRDARFTLQINPGAGNGEIPPEVVLSQNYPNPFDQQTTIRFGLPLQSDVKLTLYDILGRKVEIISDKQYEAGFHTEPWTPSSLASGIYLFVLQTEDKIIAKKLTYIK